METKKAEEFLKNRGYTNRVPFPYSTVVNQMTDFANQEIDKATTSQQQTIERLREYVEELLIIKKGELEYSTTNTKRDDDALKSEISEIEQLLNTAEPIDH